MPVSVSDIYIYNVLMYIYTYYIYTYNPGILTSLKKFLPASCTPPSGFSPTL